MTGAYTRLDRLLFRLAFSGIEIQTAVADVEDAAYERRFRDIEIQKPVFITSLPRAGTTLLLEIVAAAPGFATHTYRDMPFVLCPILWNEISRPFQQAGQKKERAHGDGMTATYDSPEAFEEILWLAFWPAKYREDLILLWTAEDDNPEFESFFRKHIRKLVALRTEARGDGSGSRRYVSKNNANIARIPFLRRTFPDSVIVVPFRNPIDHVGSMLRQQHNFTAIHRADAFAREYMEAIGHFEFGASRRAIEFRTTAGTLGDSQTATYWLTYWIEAFSFLIGLDPLSFRLFDYDKACARPRASLDGLARAIEFEPTGAGVAAAHAFHDSVRYNPRDLALDPSLLARAMAIHAVLVERAINATA
ncbi:MAG: sulfotransferase [Rhizomicrobium sp.]